jgi:hypothetical protein
MDKILQTLFESNILNAETKQLIESQFAESLDLLLKEERQKIEDEVRIEMTEQLRKDRELLTEALDLKLESIVEAEYAELREDIESFRDLEVEYAERLIEERAELRNEAKESVLELVEKLDMFLEMRMDEEFEELRDDLHEAKRNNLGKKVFEAFKQEFASIINEDEQQASDELEIMREQLEDMKAELQVARNNVLKEERKAKMASLLSNLEDNSNAKAKMQELLKNIPTTKLDESYSRYLPHVIGESIDSKTAITESKQTQKPNLNEGRVVTGNKDNQTNDVDVETALKRLRQLAGNN